MKHVQLNTCGLQDTMTDERLKLFAVELSKLVLIKTYEDGFKIGELIRKELEREYRRGYVAGVADKKRGEIQ